MLSFIIWLFSIVVGVFLDFLHFIYAEISDCLMIEPNQESHEPRIKWMRMD